MPPFIVTLQSIHWFDRGRGRRHRRSLLTWGSIKFNLFKVFRWGCGSFFWVKDIPPWVSRHGRHGWLFRSHRGDSRLFLGSYYHRLTLAIPQEEVHRTSSPKTKPYKHKPGEGVPNGIPDQKHKYAQRDRLNGVEKQPFVWVIVVEGPNKVRNEKQQSAKERVDEPRHRWPRARPRNEQHNIQRKKETESVYAKPLVRPRIR